MSDKLQVAATSSTTDTKDKTPDGSCCTAPPDGDPGPIKP